jgi:hypothetical protein
MYSLNLDGIDGYARVANSAELNDLSAITIEAWVFRRITTRQETVVGNGWNNSYWLGFSPAGKLRFASHGGDGVDSYSTVYSDSWNHVAVSYNGTERRYYINGVLDRVTTTGAGAIAANPTDPLGIGYDVDLIGDNFFKGLIDEVRIWNTVRTPAEIQANLFHTLSSPFPASLIGYWKMDGNPDDETGDHDGVMQGMIYGFVNDGAMPRNIRIPQIGTAPTLDGECGTSEYSSATVVSVEGVLVSLQHTASDLWACFDFNIQDGFTRTSLLIDPGRDRIDPAQLTDFRFDVTSAYTRQTYVGDAAGSWAPTTAFSSDWDGEWKERVSGEITYYSAEFRVDQTLTGGWGSVMGLALDPYWPGMDSIDRVGMWPVQSNSRMPSTWSGSILSDLGPTRTFTGQVNFQSRNPAYGPEAVNGATVELYGYDSNGSEAMVGVVTSGALGFYSLTTNDDYTRHRLEVSQLPQGYTSTGAQAPAPAVVIDERTIDYPDISGGTYADNNFVLGEPLPFNRAAQYGPVFLIIAPQAVIEAGALDEFTDFKTQQGFAVLTRSVEYADAHYSGTTRLERIRAMEQDFLQQYGARFKYVMMVGGHDTIPFAKITPYSTGTYPTCPSEDPVNYKFSDWLYVDLTSELNSNHNNCFVDGTLSKPLDRVSSYVPDNFAFQPTVAFGRIPFNDQNIVHQVLHNSIGFEQQSENYKTKALTGMSLFALRGFFDGVSCEDHWDNHCVPWDSYTSNYDYSVVTEQMQGDFFDADGYSIAKLYENEPVVAGGLYTSDPDLTLENILATMDDGRFGLSVMTGHGNSWGVYRTFWEADKNGSGFVDVSDNASVTELAGLTFFDKGVLSQTDPEGGRGSIYVLIACSTADPNDPSNLAATILAGGHGPASVGSLSTSGVGSWWSESDKNAGTIGYFVVRRLLHNHYRMGESVWWVLADLIQRDQAGSGGVTYSLYGDPTLSYFANPGGETALDPWPMGRRDGSGASYLSLHGPTSPKLIWQHTAGIHWSDTFGPTVLARANGEVIAAADSHVDVLRQGALFQRLALDTQVYGSPAVSADGTIYVMDQAANLYAFANKRSTILGVIVIRAERERRWKVNLGVNPQASPVVGSDGFILAGVGGLTGTDPRMWLVRPDGVASLYIPLNTPPVSYAAVDANRAIYVTTESNGGLLYRAEPFCNQSPLTGLCTPAYLSSTTISRSFVTPPVLWQDSVYAGDEAGVIYRFDKNTLALQSQYATGSLIQSVPVVSPNGDIVVANANGILFSLSPDLQTVRWQKYLDYNQFYGIPAASANAIYLAFNGSLRAYNPSSGAELWRVGLGDANFYGSVSLGYGREIFIQEVYGQRVLALSEGWGLSPAAISAVAGISQVDGSNIITVNVSQSIPPIPDAPAAATSPASPADGQAIEQVSAATLVGILLQRSVDGSPWQEAAILDPADPSFIDTDIQDDTNYRYRAQNLMSDGAYSDFAMAPYLTRSHPALPGAPTLDSVTAVSSEAIRLEWSPSIGSTYDSYLVQRALSGGKFDTVRTVTSATHDLVDGDLLPGTSYSYQVIGVNRAGESAPSNALSDATLRRSLAAPQRFQATLSGKSQIQLTWTPGPAFTNAVIEVTAMGKAGYDPLTVVLASSGQFSYNFNEPGAYDFRIKYANPSDESPYAYSDTSVVITQTIAVYIPMIRR